MIEVLMFTSENCGACKMMKPQVDALPNARIVDVVDEPQLAMQHRVMGGLPVFVKLVNGSFDSRANGAMSPKAFNEWVAV